MCRFLGRTVFYLFFICSFTYGLNLEQDVISIAKLMDAYDKRLDSIKLEFSYKSLLNKDKSRFFIDGSYARKLSEGCELYDHKNYRGPSCDEKKFVSGLASSFDGVNTWYLGHKKNKHGYYMAAISPEYAGRNLKSQENPYYMIWYYTPKHKFSELLTDPEAQPKIQEEEIVDGLQCIKINFQAGSGFYDCNIWVSPEKNYLPVKFTIYTAENKELFFTREWKEFKKLPDGSWFPMRIIITGKDRNNPSEFIVKNIDISPLTREDFRLEFPDFTHVTDHVAGISYVTAEPSSSVEPGGLSIFNKKKCSNINNKEHLLDKYIEHEKMPIQAQEAWKEKEIQQSPKANVPLNKNKGRMTFILAAFGLAILFFVIIIFIMNRKGKR